MQDTSSASDSLADYETLPAPITSINDKRQFKVLRLSNGLTACLVSTGHTTDQNPETLKKSLDQAQNVSAAAMCVGVGSFSDPEDVPGMAHFVEHMLFMGTEKYPEENDFDAFLAGCGGHSNASTNCERTTYYFKCFGVFFYEALSRFVTFFVAPLMKKDSIARERESMESEFQLMLPMDFHRKRQLIMSTLKSDGFRNGFPWGNMQTLRDNLSEDELYKRVHEFRSRHYSAHRMTLAIQSTLPLSILEGYTLELFSSIPNNGLPPLEFGILPLQSEEFAQVYYVTPVNSSGEIQLSWLMPPALDKYKTKPHQYLAWLIGHEGHGSLLNHLRDKSWVLNLKASNNEFGFERNSVYRLFTVTISLTSQGWLHLFEIIEIVYSYINMLKSQEPSEVLFNEIKQTRENSFTFFSPEPVIKAVKHLARSMHIYPSEDYIRGVTLFFEYNAQDIKQVLDNFVVAQMNVIVLTATLPKDCYFDKVEKWFSTSYTSKHYSKDWIKRWQHAKPSHHFHLPAPNKFLTRDFTILPMDSYTQFQYPVRVLANGKLELWYKRDKKFRIPKAFYYVCLLNPNLVTMKNAAMLDLFVVLLDLDLAKECYPARLANLSYSIKSYRQGLIVKVWGYNEKLHMLIDLISKQLLTVQVTQEKFNAVKESVSKSYYNTLLEPTVLAKDTILEMLIDNYNSFHNKHKFIESVTLKDLQEYPATFLSKLYVKALVQGNVTVDFALEVISSMMSRFQAKPVASLPKTRIIELPEGESVCTMRSLNSGSANSVIINYYQCSRFSIFGAVLIKIIESIIQEPLFNTLRTKEQLGYDVYYETNNMHGVLGFTITLNTQANKTPPGHANDRIDSFIADMSTHLSSLPSENFETIRNNLIKIKLSTDVNLMEEVNRNWSEILDDTYMFDKAKQEIRVLEALNSADVLAWWLKYCVKPGKKCRKLSVQVLGLEENTSGLTQTISEVSTEGGLNLRLDIEYDSFNGIDGQTTRVFTRHVNDFKDSQYLYPVIFKPKFFNK